MGSAGKLNGGIDVLADNLLPRQLATVHLLPVLRSKGLLWNPQPKLR